MNFNDYEFVIYGYDIDYFRYMFTDVTHTKLTYIGNPIIDFCKNPILRLYYSFYKHKRIWKQFNLPETKIWNKYYLPNFSTDKPLCFIFLMRWLKPENEFLLEEIHKLYPNAKMVLYFEDLYRTGEKTLNYDFLDKYFDLVISYDTSDANKYGFYYHPTFLSKIEDEKFIKHKYDISFYGAAKNRYNTIINAYNILKNRGYKCDFSVSRLSPDMKKFKGIKYIKRLIPYKSYLKHTLSSKCIMEIMQENCSGYTLRTWEAILYNRKLITNNKAILKAPFYNEDQFIYFENVEDLRHMNIDKIFHTNKYVPELNPENFLQFIVEKF